MHNLFLVYLSISTCSGRLCAHHQEKQMCFATLGTCYCVRLINILRINCAQLALFTRLYRDALSAEHKHIYCMVRIYFIKYIVWSCYVLWKKLSLFFVLIAKRLVPCQIMWNLLWISGSGAVFPLVLRFFPVSKTSPGLHDHISPITDATQS
jgi:hypothetical protein